MKKLALAVAFLLCGQVYAADDWAQRWPNNTPIQVITPATGASTFLKLDQSTPQTIAGGAPNFSSAIDFTQIATPANPPAGSNRLYFKNDDKLYQLTSGGSESLVGGGGGSSVSFGSAGQIPYTNATTDDFSYGTGLSWNPATSTLTATNITGDLTGNVTGNVSGNASTATSASSAASATNAANTAITDDTTTNAIMYPTWVTANTGNLPQKVSSTKLSFNPSSGLLTATGFSGPLTGNVTGNVSGNAGTVTNGVYTTDAGTVFLAPNGDGQNLSNVIHSESDPLSATKALDNIASCAINTSLLSDTADTDSLGSADKEWLNLYIGDAGKIYLGLGQDTSIHRSGANEMTLTASSGVKATNFISTASLGTSPYACTSTTLNTNLNADLLDGQHGTYYAVATDYLKLNQSTPQTVTGGAPNFSGGLDSGSSVNITGSADTVQLKVKANNPQVNDILQVLASDGTTKQFAIDGSGNLLFKTGQDIRPTSDSTTAINIAKADGTDWVTFDTTNKKIGINTTPTYKIDLRSDGVDTDSDFSISNSDYSHFIRLFPGRQSDPNPFILWKNGDPMRFVNDSGGWNELGRFSASGNLLVGTTDDDGTPPTGKLVVKGTTNDGSTNIQVWRDSDEANVATLDTDGNIITSGSAQVGGATGAKLSAASGVLTMAGVGGTNNENLTFNFESLSNTVQVNSSSSVDNIGLVDLLRLNFGTGLDVAFVYQTQGNDNLQLGITCGSADDSGYFSIMERADIGNANRSPSGTSADPVLRIYSSDAGVAADYLEFYHNQTNPVINAGNGALILSGANVLINSTDDDGTPPTGKLVVKGSTNNGSTNIFVGRDSDNANVATLDTDGNLMLGLSSSNTRVYFQADTDQWVGDIGNGLELNYYGRGNIQLGYNTCYWTNAGVNEIVLNNSTHVQMPQYGAGTATFGSTGIITSTSDERLKDIQGSFTRGLKDLEGIRPIFYKWNDKSGMNDDTIYAGFSAQNIQKNIPEAVGQNPEGYLSLQDRPILATLVNAVKEQQKQIDDLKSRIEKLEGKKDEAKLPVGVGIGLLAIGGIYYSRRRNNNA